MNTLTVNELLDGDVSSDRTGGNAAFDKVWDDRTTEAYS